MLQKAHVQISKGGAERYSSHRPYQNSSIAASLKPEQRKQLFIEMQSSAQTVTDIARQFSIPLYLVRQVCLLQEQNSQQTSYWSTWNQLHHQIGSQFYLLTEAVEQAMKETPRASSLGYDLHMM